MVRFIPPREKGLKMGRGLSAMTALCLILSACSSSVPSDPTPSPTAEATASSFTPSPTSTAVSQSPSPSAEPTPSATLSPPWPSGPYSISGKAYFFSVEDEQIDQIMDVKGAVVYLLEAPDQRQTLSETDEHAFRFEGLSAGAEVTVALEHPTYMPTLTATLTVGEGDITGLTFQMLPASLELLVEPLLGVDISDPTLCHMATTLTVVGGSDIWAKGEAGATVQIEPALPPDLGPYYFNEVTMPDPALTETTTDGGVLYVGAQPGIYELRGYKDGITFESLKLRCESGFLTNASPPFGMNIIPPPGS